MLFEFKCPMCEHEYEAEVNVPLDFMDHNICPERDYYFVPHRKKGNKDKMWSFVDKFLESLGKAKQTKEV